MARFLFVSAPLPGHMDWGGMHRTATSLLARGHEVLWVTEATGAAHLRALGIPTAEVPTTGWLWPPPAMPSHLSPQERALERQRRAVAIWLDPERVIPATTALLSHLQCWWPDVLVTEPFVAAAGLAAEVWQVPLVVAGWPATRMPAKVPPHQAEAAHVARKWFKHLCAHFGVRGTCWTPGPVPWLRSPHAHIAYFTPEWYAAWHVLIPPTVFVGGRPAPLVEPTPPWLDALSTDTPLVLITLGSTFTSDEAFFSLAVDAVGVVKAQAVIAAGSEAAAEQLRSLFPPGVIVEPWVSYPHLFPRLQLVIHHGGMGTTHTALVHAVPQLIIPHAADQHYQAARVVRTGVGMALRPQEVTRQRLRAAVHWLLTEPAWRARAREVATAMAALGGVERAADVLEEVAARSQVLSLA